MRYSKETAATPHIDAVAEPTDHVDVRVEDRHGTQTLYVDVNGITVLRIGRLTTEVEVTRTV